MSECNGNQSHSIWAPLGRIPEVWCIYKSKFNLLLAKARDQAKECAANIHQASSHVVFGKVESCFLLGRRPQTSCSDLCPVWSVTETPASTDNPGAKSELCVYPSAFLTYGCVRSKLCVIGQRRLLHLLLLVVNCSCASWFLLHQWISLFQEPFTVLTIWFLTWLSNTLLFGARVERDVVFTSKLNFEFGLVEMTLVHTGKQTLSVNSLISLNLKLHQSG